MLVEVGTAQIQELSIGASLILDIYGIREFLWLISLVENLDWLSTIKHQAKALLHILYLTI